MNVFVSSAIPVGGQTAAGACVHGVSRGQQAGGTHRATWSPPGTDDPSTPSTFVRVTGMKQGIFPFINEHKNRCRHTDEEEDHPR